MRPEPMHAFKAVETRPAAALPQHSAVELTNGGGKAIISLNDQEYTLHITKQGKLLLTK